MPRYLALLSLLLGSLAASGAEQAPLFPFVLPWDDASPGVTDLSGLLPKPAGALGPARVGADGHLYTGDQRLRLHGIDLAFSANFPTHEQAEKIAARLAKFGNNVVRFHIMDMWRYPGGLLARNVKSTREFEPEALERLDYFTSQLRARGIYIYLCLLNYRPVNAADGLPPEIEQLGGTFQGRHVPGFWDPVQMALQKEYARNLLLHRNAYTGLAYAADPAVVMVEINNEAGLLHAWLGGTLDGLPQVFQLQLRDRWNAWLSARYGDTATLRAAWNQGAAPLGAELLQNTDFGAGLAQWELELHEPAVATTSLADPAPPDLASSRALRVDVTTPGTQSWHIRFQQAALATKADQPYTLSGWVRAAEASSLRLGLALAHAPWNTVGGEQTVPLSTAWQPFKRVVRPATNDDAMRLVIDLPQRPCTVWLAGLSVRQGGGGGLPEAESAAGARVNGIAFAQRGQRTPAVIGDWMRFLWEIEDRYWQTLYHYLKDELRIQPLVIGTVVGCSTPNMQARMDAIDTHSYWQHPAFPGQPWDRANWYVKNASMVNDNGGMLPWLARYRVLGKPFCITEYGNPSPNTYGSEGRLLRAPYACLQDWDYLSTSRYAQRSDFDLRRMRNWFDIDQHPTKMMTLIPAAAMFLRGDVEPAQQTVVARLDTDRELALLPRQRQWNLIDLGADAIPPTTALVHRMALVVQGQTAPPGALRPDQVQPQKDVFVSDTGQLRWDRRIPTRSVVTADTARSKMVVGHGAGQRYVLGGVTVEPGPTRQDGWSALSLTAMRGDLLGGPASILITATGDVENSNWTWTSPARESIGANWGEAPTLVEGIPARFALRSPATRTRVWALDERGQRRGAVPCEPGPTGLASFAIGPQHRTLWYEVEVR